MYWDNGNENGNYYSILGLYPTTSSNMESTIVSWECIGIMERKTEATTVLVAIIMHMMKQWW